MSLEGLTVHSFRFLVKICSLFLSMTTIWMNHIEAQFVIHIIQQHFSAVRFNCSFYKTAIRLSRYRAKYDILPPNLNSNWMTLVIGWSRHVIIGCGFNIIGLLGPRCRGKTYFSCGTRMVWQVGRQSHQLFMKLGALRDLYDQYDQ